MDGALAQLERARQGLRGEIAALSRQVGRAADGTVAAADVNAAAVARQIVEADPALLRSSQGDPGAAATLRLLTG